MSESLLTFMDRAILESRRNKRRQGRSKRRSLSRYFKRGTEKDYPMTIERDDHFLAAGDLTDFVTGRIIGKRISGGLDTITAELNLITTFETWENFIKFEAGDFDSFQCVQFDSRSGMYIAEDGEYQEFFTYRVTNSTSSVKIQGSQEFVDEISAVFLAEFKISNSNLDWIYSSDGNSITVALREDRNPISEMYSFLTDGETLEQYYDRFMASSASILLLIGKPGTGKTSFIRGLLQHTSSNAIVTYDPQVLSKDYVFAQFIEGDSSVFVIEDADTLLRARADGNDLMHKFLNVGEGLVTTAGKKMIFSTNLPSVRDVDQALIRPGRCFDVVTFDEILHAKAEILCAKLNMPMPAVVKKQYSLAELFHEQPVATSGKSSSKVGFM